MTSATRPDPGRVEGAPRALRPSRAPSPRGTPHPACPATLGQVCGSSVQSAVVSCRCPPGDRGSRSRHRNPKGMSRGRRPIPRPTNQDAPPCPVTLYPGCDSPLPLPPAGSGDPDYWSHRWRGTLWLGSRPAPHPTQRQCLRCQARQAGPLLGVPWALLFCKLRAVAQGSQGAGFGRPFIHPARRSFTSICSDVRPCELART